MRLIYVYTTKLIVSNLFKEVGRDVGGGEAGLEAVNVNDHSLLAGDAGDTARDALEGTVGDTYQVVGDEMAGAQIDLHHVLVEQGGGLD